MQRWEAGTMERQRRRSVLGLGQKPSTSDHAPASSGFTQISRERRPAHLLEAIKKLDMRGIATVDNSTIVESIRDWYTDEYQGSWYEESYSKTPIGFVMKCYLGPPFVVHIVDLVGQIVEHYSLVEEMPSKYAAGRTLAMNPSYELVEVYDNGMVAIRSDGTPVEVKE